MAKKAYIKAVFHILRVKIQDRVVKKKSGTREKEKRTLAGKSNVQKEKKLHRSSHYETDKNGLCFIKNCVIEI